MRNFVTTKRRWLGGFLAGFLLLLATLAGGPPVRAAATATAEAGAAAFPLPAAAYGDDEGRQGALGEVLARRAAREPLNLVATLLFLGAIVHTFLAPRLTRLSHRWEREHRARIEREGRTAAAKPQADARDDVSFGAEMMHFFGEVEAVFGIWVVPLLVGIVLLKDWPTAQGYIGHGVNFTEAIFVVVVLAVAGTRPVLRFAESLLARVAALGGDSPRAWWFAILTLGPLLGSLITEPAAMTLCALLLGRRFYDLRPSRRLAYATLGLLFVNVSIGGTLTNFAAPPVLIVANRWGWSSGYMLTHFGGKALVSIVAANVLCYACFRREFLALGKERLPAADADVDIRLATIPPRVTAAEEVWERRTDPVPLAVTVVHLFFLAWTVVNAHSPALVIGGLLFFLAFTTATEHHQNPVPLKSALLVGFFLAGLVVHGGLQGWWIAPVLGRLGELPLLFGATFLTAFNDNAAITYLASLAPDFTEGMRYAVVAGAVAGGGLTVIANAPNPAGQSLLARYFPDGVSPLGLLAGAAPPTVIALGVFLLWR